MKFKINRLEVLVVLLSTLILVSSCSSSTTINSSPSNAKVFLNGELVGITPHRLKDVKTTGAASHIKLEKEGYEDFYTTFYKNEKVHIGALVSGVFLLVPFFWIMKYKPERNFEMTPLTNSVESQASQATSNPSKEPRTLSQEEKIEQLRALKPLLDNGEISRKEYDLLRKEILGN